jgi:hypothetical protein
MPTPNDQLTRTTDYSQRLVVKFGDMMGAGFTVLPNILLKYQAELKINANELNFIAQVWYHWWNDRDAYPAMTTISKRMGAKDHKTARRASKALQDKGYLVVRDRVSRGKGQLSSEYDFSPLIQLLNDIYAKEEAERLREVAGDWVVLERENTPPTQIWAGGSPIFGQGPYPQMGNEEYKEKKTNIEKDSLFSNGLEDDANLQKPSNSMFSKKRDKFETTTAVEGYTVRPRGRPRKEGFTPIADLLISNVKKRGRRSSKTAPEGSSDTQASGNHHHLVESLPKRGRGRPPKAPPQIEWLITEISGEFHDNEASFRSNVSRAARLWKDSGRSESDFAQLVGEARSITKTYDIQKRASGDAGEWGARNKVPYFFSVLTDLLGLKDKGGSG